MNPNHRLLVDSNDPILKRIADPVEPGENVDAVMRTMKDVCRQSKVKGAGLAAPQVGVSKRVIFIGLIHPLFMINPVIVDSAKDSIPRNEGCLSYPGKEKVVARPSWVTVQYLGQRRATHTETYHGYTARVIMHEIDHLNGICRVGDDSPPDA